MNRSTRLVMLGTGVAALILSTAAWSRGRRVNLVSGGHDALKATEKQAKHAMEKTPEKVTSGIDRFHELFEDFRPSVVSDRSRWLYSPDVYFNDGIAELKGSDAVARYLGRAATATASLSVDVEEMTRTDNGVYIRWIMRVTTKPNAMTIIAPGISHLRFNEDGRITYHRDYWDASAALSEMVPLAGFILKAIKANL